MIEQISIALATPIAKSIFDKFYEGVGSKLGEQAVEKLPEKVKQLGQLVWDKCLRNKPDTIKLLERAANNSTEDQQELTEYLHRALNLDSLLKHKVEELVHDIYQIIQANKVEARNVLNISDGMAQQINDPNSQVIFTGNNATFHFGVSPEASLKPPRQEPTELNKQNSLPEQHPTHLPDTRQAWSTIQARLKNPEQLKEMFRALYLLIQIDKYRDVGISNDLWGWSVCDADRKKEVAIPLEQEPRKASLLVSYFAQSAINEFLRSLGLHRGNEMRETLLDYCYVDQQGYFGQPRETVISFETGASSQIIPQNIRHTVNSAKALLLCGNPDDKEVMSSVINYLKTCKGDRLWAEEPFPYRQSPRPDCKTCSQVLEFFSLMEDSHLFFNYLSNEDRHWLKERKLEGLEWLKGHKYQEFLWDYKVDIGKQLQSDNLTLFHTVCVLYCCRFYLCYDSQRIFEPSIKGLFALLKRDPYPGLLPVGKTDSRPHLCHTAFFISSLSQKVSTFNDERLEIISQSLDSIALYFLNQFRNDSLDTKIPDLDHYADGWALMLNLSTYLGGAKGQGLSVEDIRSLDKQAQHLTSLIDDGISEQFDIDTWKREIQNNLGDFPYLWHLIYQRIIKQRQLKKLG